MALSFVSTIPFFCSFQPQADPPTAENYNEPNAPPAGAGCVGGVGSVQPRCRSASLPRSLGRSLICPPGSAGMLAWPPAFYAEVRFGSLCKDSLKNSFYFILTCGILHCKIPRI